MPKMTDRELMRRALRDAASWRHSLAEASGMDSVSGKEAALRASQYRELLKRKYGQGDDAVDDVRLARIEGNILRRAR